MADAASSTQRHDGSQPPAATPIHTTTIQARDIHCITCVNHIKDELEAYEPEIFDVTVRIIGSEITVVHTPNITPPVLAQAVSDGGFEVFGASAVDEDGKIIFQRSFDPEMVGWFDDRQGRWMPDPTLSAPEVSWLSPFSAGGIVDAYMRRPSGNRQKRHIENCAACRAGESSDHAAQRQRSQEIRKGYSSNEAKNATSATSKQTSETCTVGQDMVEEPAVAPQSWVRQAGQVPASPAYSIPVTMPAKSFQSTRWRLTLSIGGMTCASCTTAVTEAVNSIDAVRTVRIDLMGHSGSIEFEGQEQLSKEIVDAIEDIGYDVSIVELQMPTPVKEKSKSRAARERLYRARLSIGGMTCAACSAAITNGLGDLDFVKNSDIVLLTNSGEVTYNGQANIDKITEKIDGLGYDVTVEEVKELDASVAAPESSVRTVQIKIDGMYCDHCPARVTQLLSQQFGSNVAVERQPSLKAPMLTVTYLPRVPEFTIRDIMATINDGDEDWRPSIYRPPSLEERSKKLQEKERWKIQWRLLIATIAAIPTVVIAVGIMNLPDSDYLRQYMMQTLGNSNIQRDEAALFILSTVVYFTSGSIFHLKALQEIKTLWRPSSRVPILRRFYRFGSMNMLISAGTTVAYVSSLALMVIEAVHPSANTTDSSYFDSVVFLTWFILVGRLIEAYSKSKTGDAVSMLGQLRPDTARLLVQDPANPQNSEEQEGGITSHSTKLIPTGLLEVGDTVTVAHGASPPTDGIIVWGEGRFDESSLTGESRPVAKAVGEKIFVGTINIGQPITMSVADAGGRSMLDEIVSVVREGLSKRAPVERVADVVTGYFVPVISLLAIITFIVWCILGYTGALEQTLIQGRAGGWAFWSLNFAISVFVAACPCGIGLAAPTALFVGIGLAAKHGILVRGGGQAFQDAPEIDAVVFDKTGTLTEGGDVKVTAYESFLEDDEEKLKIANAIATHLESQSTHPMAAAVAKFLSEKPTASVDVQEINETPGRGLQGRFAKRSSDKSAADTVYEAAIGSPAYITTLNSSLLAPGTSAEQSLAEWQSQAKSVAVLALRNVSATATADGVEPGWSLAALFGTSDPVRPSAAPTIAALQKRGLQVFMLSGDNPATAKAVGVSLGIPNQHIFAGVLPTEKADRIKHLQRTLPRRSAGRTSLLNYLKRGKTAQTPAKPSAEAMSKTSAEVSAGLGPDLEKTAGLDGTEDSPKGSSPDPSPHQARIAFVGDGINDAPALIAASLSISLASGSSVALTASSFVLLHPSLAGVVELLDLSRRVMRRVTFNYAWACVYNVILIPVAAGVLFRVKAGGWSIPPAVAAGAMACSSVSVVLSSLALRVEAGSVKRGLERAFGRLMGRVGGAGAREGGE